MSSELQKFRASEVQSSTSSEVQSFVSLKNFPEKFPEKFRGEVSLHLREELVEYPQRLGIFSSPRSTDPLIPKLRCSLARDLTHRLSRGIHHITFLRGSLASYPTHRVSQAIFLVHREK